MHETVTLSLVLFFAALVALAFSKRSFFPGRMIYLMRALFPSWRFFDDFGGVPELYYRIGEDGTEWSPWEVCLERPKRHPVHFILNARGNLYLACNGLVQHLMDDVPEDPAEDSSSVSDLVSYKLVRHLVAERAGEAGAAKNYQFKICVRGHERPEQEPRDVLISPVYKAGSL